MGYNTVAVLLNDSSYEIEKSGSLGARIASAMRAWGWRSRDDLRFGAGSVISQDHADGHQVVVVHGNTGWRLDDPEIPQACIDMAIWHLKERGYRITKPKPSTEGKTA